MRELLNIHIGQCGVQMGNAVWELLCQEHQITTQGIQLESAANNPPIEDASFQSFFCEASEARYVPLALLCDLEPTVIDEIRTGPYRQLFHEDKMISGMEDAANNFARGCYSASKQIVERVVEQIQTTLEQCEAPQGFIIYRSLGGGTGSGFTSHLFDYLEDYGKLCRVEFPVYPSTLMTSSVVEPYNFVLGQHFCMDDIDISLLFDNDALYRLLQKSMRASQPTFSDVNRILAQICSSITSATRFENYLNNDILTMQTNLVPYPRIHFPISSYSPLSSRNTALYTSHSVQDLTRWVFQPSSQLVSVDTSQGKYMSCSLIYRGDVTPQLVYKGIASVKADINNKFVEWSPAGFKVGIVRQPPSFTPQSILGPSKRNVIMLTNNSAIGQVIQRMVTTCSMLYTKRAFVHWFVGEGLEECEFAEAQNNLQALVRDYEEITQDLPMSNDRGERNEVKSRESKSPPRKDPSERKSPPPAPPFSEMRSTDVSNIYFDEVGFSDSGGQLRKVGSSDENGNKNSGGSGGSDKNGGSKSVKSSDRIKSPPHGSVSDKIASNPYLREINLFSDDYTGQPTGTPEIDSGGKYPTIKSKSPTENSFSSKVYTDPNLQSDSHIFINKNGPSDQSRQDTHRFGAKGTRRQKKPQRTSTKSKDSKGTISKSSFPNGNSQDDKLITIPEIESGKPLPEFTSKATFTLDINSFQEIPEEGLDQIPSFVVLQSMESKQKSSDEKSVKSKSSQEKPKKRKHSHSSSSSKSAKCVISTTKAPEESTTKIKVVTHDVNLFIELPPSDEADNEALPTQGLEEKQKQDNRFMLCPTPDGAPRLLSYDRPYSSRDSGGGEPDKTVPTNAKIKSKSSSSGSSSSEEYNKNPTEINKILSPVLECDSFQENSKFSGKLGAVQTPKNFDNIDLSINELGIPENDPFGSGKGISSTTSSRRSSSPKSLKEAIKAANAVIKTYPSDDEKQLSCVPEVDSSKQSTDNSINKHSKISSSKGDKLSRTDKSLESSSQRKIIDTGSSAQESYLEKSSNSTSTTASKSDEDEQMFISMSSSSKQEEDEDKRKGLSPVPECTEGRSTEMHLHPSTTGSSKSSVTQIGLRDMIAKQRSSRSSTSMSRSQIKQLLDLRTSSSKSNDMDKEEEEEQSYPTIEKEDIKPEVKLGYLTQPTSLQTLTGLSSSTTGQSDTLVSSTQGTSKSTTTPSNFGSSSRDSRAPTTEWTNEKTSTRDSNTSKTGSKSKTEKQLVQSKTNTSSFGSETIHGTLFSQPTSPAPPSEAQSSKSKSSDTPESNGNSNGSENPNLKQQNVISKTTTDVHLQTIRNYATKLDVKKSDFPLLEAKGEPILRTLTGSTDTRGSNSTQPYTSHSVTTTSKITAQISSGKRSKSSESDGNESTAVVSRIETGQSHSRKHSGDKQNYLYTTTTATDVIYQPFTTANSSITNLALNASFVAPVASPLNSEAPSTNSQSTNTQNSNESVSVVSEQPVLKKNHITKFYSKVNSEGMKIRTKSASIAKYHSSKNSQKRTSSNKDLGNTSAIETTSKSVTELVPSYNTHLKNCTNVNVTETFIHPLECSNSPSKQVTNSTVDQFPVRKSSEIHDNFIKFSPIRQIQPKERNTQSSSTDKLETDTDNMHVLTSTQQRNSIKDDHYQPFTTVNSSTKVFVKSNPTYQHEFSRNTDVESSQIEQTNTTTDLIYRPFNTQDSAALAKTHLTTSHFTQSGMLNYGHQTSTTEQANTGTDVIYQPFTTRNSSTKTVARIIPNLPFNYTKCSDVYVSNLDQTNTGGTDVLYQPFTTLNSSTKIATSPSRPNSKSSVELKVHQSSHKDSVASLPQEGSTKQSEMSVADKVVWKSLDSCPASPVHLQVQSPRSKSYDGGPLSDGNNTLGPNKSKKSKKDKKLQSSVIVDPDDKMTSYVEKNCPKLGYLILPSSYTATVTDTKQSSTDQSLLNREIMFNSSLNDFDERNNLSMPIPTKNILETKAIVKNSIESLEKQIDASGNRTAPFKQNSIGITVTTTRPSSQTYSFDNSEDEQQNLTTEKQNTGTDILYQPFTTQNSGPRQYSVNDKTTVATDIMYKSFTTKTSGQPQYSTVATKTSIGTDMIYQPFTTQNTEAAILDELEQNAAAKNAESLSLKKYDIDDNTDKSEPINQTPVSRVYNQFQTDQDCSMKTTISMKTFDEASDVDTKNAVDNFINQPFLAMDSNIAPIIRTSPISQASTIHCITEIDSNKQSGGVKASDAKPKSYDIIAVSNIPQVSSGKHTGNKRLTTQDSSFFSKTLTTGGPTSMASTLHFKTTQFSSSLDSSVSKNFSSSNSTSNSGSASKSVLDQSTATVGTSVAETNTQRTLITESSSEEDSTEDSTEDSSSSETMELLCGTEMVNSVSEHTIFKIHSCEKAGERRNIPSPKLGFLIKPSTFSKTLLTSASETKGSSTQTSNKSSRKKSKRNRSSTGDSTTKSLIETMSQPSQSTSYVSSTNRLDPNINLQPINENLSTEKQVTPSINLNKHDAPPAFSAASNNKLLAQWNLEEQRWTKTVLFRPNLLSTATATNSTTDITDTEDQSLSSYPFTRHLDAQNSNRRLCIIDATNSMKESSGRSTPISLFSPAQVSNRKVISTARIDVFEPAVRIYLNSPCSTISQHKIPTSDKTAETRHCDIEAQERHSCSRISSCLNIDSDIEENDVSSHMSFKNYKTNFIKNVTLNNRLNTNNAISYSTQTCDTSEATAKTFPIHGKYQGRLKIRTTQDSASKHYNESDKNIETFENQTQSNKSHGILKITKDQCISNKNSVTNRKSDENILTEKSSKKQDKKRRRSSESSSAHEQSYKNIGSKITSSKENIASKEMTEASTVSFIVPDSSNKLLQESTINIRKPILGLRKQTSSKCNENVPVSLSMEPSPIFHRLSTNPQNSHLKCNVKEEASTQPKLFPKREYDPLLTTCSSSKSIMKTVNISPKLSLKVSESKLSDRGNFIAPENKLIIKPEADALLSTRSSSKGNVEGRISVPVKPSLEKYDSKLSEKNHKTSLLKKSTKQDSTDTALVSVGPKVIVKQGGLNTPLNPIIQSSDSKSTEKNSRSNYISSRMAFQQLNEGDFIWGTAVQNKKHTTSNMSIPTSVHHQPKSFSARRTPVAPSPTKNINVVTSTPRRHKSTANITFSNKIMKTGGRTERVAPSTDKWLATAKTIRRSSSEVTREDSTLQSLPTIGASTLTGALTWTSSGSQETNNTTSTTTSTSYTSSSSGTEGDGDDEEDEEEEQDRVVRIPLGHAARMTQMARMIKLSPGSKQTTTLIQTAVVTNEKTPKQQHHQRQQVASPQRH